MTAIELLAFKFILIFNFKARFVSSVFPGETVVYNLWKEGNMVVFSGSTAERKLECIVGGVEIAEAPKPKL
jgi:hypothetical protein